MLKVVTSAYMYVVIELKMLAEINMFKVESFIYCRSLQYFRKHDEKCEKPVKR